VYAEGNDRKYGHERFAQEKPKHMPNDTHAPDSVFKFMDRPSLNRTDPYLDEKRKELGFENELMETPGVSRQMLVVFGEHGIKSTEDLAGCATDDLHGWIELKRGRRFRHAGILDGFGLSRTDCESIIINARINAGWIAGPDDHPNDPQVRPGFGIKNGKKF
jgi:hypothetical protein